MATEFAMPKLGLTMESGTILKWLVPDGAEVTTGQAVLLVETDKVETEIEASGSGVLAQTGEIGEEYACGVRIGWFLEAGEAPPASDAAPPAASPAVAASAPAAAATTARPQPQLVPAAPVRAPGERILASPAAKRLARELAVDLAAVAGTGPKGRITERDVRAAAEASASPPDSPTQATAGVQAGLAPTGSAAAADAPAQPGSGVTSVGAHHAETVSRPATLAARQLADLLGVDLRNVQATAADGRISRTDVAAHVRSVLAGLSPLNEGDRSATDPGGPRAPVPAVTAVASRGATPDAASSAAPLSQTPTEEIPLRGMRGVIAERMSASLHGMAQLTITMDVNMSAVVAERAGLAEAARAADSDVQDGADGDEPPVVPGYTDYVVAASAAALQAHRRVNSQVTASAVALLPDIHVGLAVALDDGLLVPVIRHADRLSLSEIAAETKRLADGARNSTLGYDDYQGATFTVTALGMFGVDAFTPIINAPNTAILGVGRIRNDTVWTDDAPSARPTLTLSLTWDHRAFDGAPAARFAGSVRDWLESR